MSNLVRGRPAAFLPQFVNNRWRKPKISLRKQAMLRKQALMSNKFVAGANYENGEWDPYWDTLGKSRVMKAPKGRKHERTRTEKMERIKTALREMDTKIQEQRDSRPKPLIYQDQLLKKFGMLD